jgi:catechol 2,3-dioxygenase-like lactoylglutathione lyase family enzyme
MSDRLRPKSLDHVALWLAERDALTAFCCAHLGMHEIERTDRFTLLGVDARRGKLTLFDAPGPREPGILGRVALRVGDLDAALARLPEDLAVRRDGDLATFGAPAGVELALVERRGTDLDYDLDHVVVRASDPAASAAALERLGFDRDGDGRMAVAGKHVVLEPGGAEEGERPLLNHLAVLVDSAAEVEELAPQLGAEVADVVDAANTLAVFLWAPDRLKVEYVEHKPTFSLV